MTSPDWDQLADDADNTPRAVIAAAAGLLHENEPLAAVVMIAWADGTWYSDWAGSTGQGILACLGMTEAIRARLTRAANGEPDER